MIDISFLPSVTSISIDPIDHRALGRWNTWHFEGASPCEIEGGDDGPVSPTGGRAPKARNSRSSGRDPEDIGCRTGRPRGDRPILEEVDWNVRVLILTTFDPDEYVYKALRPVRAAS